MKYTHYARGMALIEGQPDKVVGSLSARSSKLWLRTRQWAQLLRKNLVVLPAEVKAAVYGPRTVLSKLLQIYIAVCAILTIIKLI